MVCSSRLRIINSKLTIDEGLVDGSMFALTPLHSDESAKRLQLLQGLLTRSIQHVAGLNPRAFRCASVTHRIGAYQLIPLFPSARIVRNDSAAKPLTRGILDGSLLSAFMELPIHRQKELTSPIGADRGQVLRDLGSLSGPW